MKIWRLVVLSMETNPICWVLEASLDWTQSEGCDSQCGMHLYIFLSLHSATLTRHSQQWQYSRVHTEEVQEISSAQGKGRKIDIPQGGRPRYQHHRIPHKCLQNRLPEKFLVPTAFQQQQEEGHETSCTTVTTTHDSMTADTQEDWEPN